ncbi:hypothetical protein D3C73_1359760 [compost metagenome]
MILVQHLIQDLFRLQGLLRQDVQAVLRRSPLCRGGLAAGYRGNQGDFRGFGDRGVFRRVFAVDRYHRNGDLACSLWIRGGQQFFKPAGGNGVLVHLEAECLGTDSFGQTRKKSN